jgi:ribonuclease P protein subunit POP4
MITAENIIQHEFIGLNTQIIDSSNSQIIGLNGTVINETKSMFTLSTIRGIKLIPKASSIWKFSLNNEKIIVDGSKIHKRPFDRLGGKL